MLEACRPGPIINLAHFGTQMREAVKYSLFLDSYNESSVTTDTGSVYYHSTHQNSVHIIIYHAEQQYKAFY